MATSFPLPDGEATAYEAEVIRQLWMMRNATPTLSAGFTITAVKLDGTYPGTSITVTWRRTSDPPRSWTCRVWGPDGTPMAAAWEVADGILLSIFEGAL